MADEARSGRESAAAVCLVHACCLDKKALSGIARAYDYLFAFNPRAAMHVAEILRDEANSLINFPHRGRPVRGTGMRELVATYPYIIRYRVVGDTVTILRIRHTSRRPTDP